MANGYITCSRDDKKNYLHLWRLAQPYLDTRDNRVHTRISVKLALQLMRKEGGNPRIVIPAVILHDVGWKRIPENLQLKAFGPGATAPGLNRIHEVEGVKIARNLLQAADYDGSMMCEILAIIGGHDSRSDAISHNDALVKDSDKLWRYTRKGFGIDTERFGESCEEGMARLREHLEDWFLTASAKKKARALLHRLFSSTA